jgi:Na+-transporting methylmalonyl-CoA/oxaloacetate decarboxylase gamma subunit
MINLADPIRITAIGMGLVFGAILLLWAVMALIVYLFRQEEDPDEELIIVSSSTPDETMMKEMAAAATVAVAFAIQHDSMQPHFFPQPPTPLVSAWQAVLRSRMITKRGSKR